MPFSKVFPRTVKGSPYPRWEEIYISELEEKEEENKSKFENIRLMKECIEDAKGIIDHHNLKRYQTDLISIAVALFEKRASHTIYWKESKAKEKFDRSIVKNS